MAGSVDKLYKKSNK